MIYPQAQEDRSTSPKSAAASETLMSASDWVNPQRTEEAEAARQIAHDRVMWEAGRLVGVEQGRAEASCTCTHPLIADSVARMFAPWDGAQAAHLRSVARFRAEHQREDIAA